jgi:Spy/CpxP family protein refolding chaperone
MWWPNPAQLERLGLTAEQRERIDRTLQSHSQTMGANSERLQKEEAEFNRLLEADPINRNAVLAQLDRVIQARAEMERTHAAMQLEMREYLTQAQWLQLPRPVMRASRFYTSKVPPGTLDVLRGGGGRGGRGQQ